MTLNMRLLATAQALPERTVSTAEVAARCGVNPRAAEAGTGVRERRWLSGDETALGLGVQAAQAALARAGLELADVDMLLNASGSQLQPIPDGAALYARALGLSGAACYSVHATCLSFLVALHHAALLVHTGQAEHVLIISSESSSLGLNFGQPESALLLGDGAAAAVIGPATHAAQGISAYRFETYPAGADFTRMRAGGSLLSPLTPGVTTAEFQFDMQGLQVLKLAARVVPPFLERLRPGLSSGLPGIDHVIPHQASAAGLALMSRYGWPADRIEVTLGHLGNVVAASLPLTLHQALECGRAGPGSTLLLAGTGAGLSTGGLILTL